MSRHIARPVRAAARAALLALMGHAILACNQGVEPAAGVSPARAALAAEIGAVRPVEGRLAGGFAYAPYPTSVPPDPGLGNEALAEALGALGAAAFEPGGGRDARAVADAGVRNLLDGKWDAAVTLLEQARKLAPRDAWIASDLAATYQARGRQLARAYDLFQALDTAGEAVRLDPSLLEARFNRALALTDLHLPWDAEEAWRDYLRGDPSSGWAAEARGHLRTLVTRPDEKEEWRRERKALEQAALGGDVGTVERIARRFPLRTRRWGEENLLARWAEARRAGRATAAGEAVRIARVVGAALARLAGDRLLLEAAERIAQVEKADPRAVADLAAGHIAYRDGVRLFDRHGAEAAPTLRSAQEALARAGSPLAHWATLYLAACDAQTYSYDALEGRLAAVDRAIAGRSYPNLAARVLWIRGLIDLVRSDYDLALTRLQKSLALVERSGEIEHAAALEGLIAEYYYWVGDPAASWAHLHKALAVYDRIPEPRRRESVVSGAASAALRSGSPEVALHFLNEAVRVAEATGQARDLASALVWRARARWQAGHHNAALRDLEAAGQAAQSMPERSRVLSETSVLLATGEVLAESDPQRAADALDRAIDLLHETDHGSALARAYHERSRIRRRLGDRAGAEQDLNAALRTIEAQRGRVSLADRASFLDVARAVYADLGLCALERGRADLAYEYAEQAQGRVLADLIAGAASSEAGEVDLLTLAEVRASLPPDTLLLQLSAWGDEVHGWAVTAGGWDHDRWAIARSDLETQLERFRTALFRDPAAAERLGSALWRRLLAPAETLLRPGMEVVLVLGDGLRSLPAAALVNPATGRHLIQDYDLSVSPSARVALSRSPRCAGPPREEPALLWVAAPAISKLHYPDLPPLDPAPAVRDAAAALFARTRALSGADATVEEVLAAAGDHELVHIATHALPSPREPLLSRILLAPDPAGGGSGALTQRHLADRAFAKTCVVELAACRTAQGPSSPTEGVLSLAYPFLAAGVPAVVATLWAVDGDAADAFSIELYRGLHAGLEVTAAASAAQRALLASDRPELRRPSAWAGFQLVGRGSFAVARPAQGARTTKPPPVQRGDRR